MAKKSAPFTDDMLLSLIRAEGTIAYLPLIARKSGLPPQEFKEAVMRLKQSGRIDLYDHDFPSSIPPNDAPFVIGLKTRRPKHMAAAK